MTSLSVQCGEALLNQLSLTPSFRDTLWHMNLERHKNLEYTQDSQHIKSWQGINGHGSLHVFYNCTTYSFWAILEDKGKAELIPGVQNGFDLIKVPMIEHKIIKDKIASLKSSSSDLLGFIQFLTRELRYPAVKQSADGYTIYLHYGGLLGGGNETSRPLSSRPVKIRTEKMNDPELLTKVKKFLLDRYEISTPTTKYEREERLINILTRKICDDLYPEQAADIQDHLAEFIDVYEKELFSEAVLETIGKSLKDGKPKLTDHTRNFSNGKLCLELLKKSYFAKEMEKGGIEQEISEKMLAELAEEIKPVIAELEERNNRAAKGEAGDGLEGVFMILEKREEVRGMLRPLSKIKAKKILNYIKDRLELETEQQTDSAEEQAEIIEELCFSEQYDKIIQEVTFKIGARSRTTSPTMLTNRSLSPTAQPDRSSSPQKNNERSISLIPVNKLEESQTFEAQKSKLSDDAEPSEVILELEQTKQLSHLDKIRLHTLVELNLLDHELTTLVELHNLLKLDQDLKNAKADKEGSTRISKNARLEDIKRLLSSIVKGYLENESVLESNELSSLLPLSFVQDVDIFRAFMGALLVDLRSDVLFEPSKVRMLSFFLINAMRNKNFNDYVKVDDLIQCLKTLKPMIEDLSITSGNLNLQEAMNSLNDILYLMGFIGASGVKGDYLDLVKDLTKHMQSHSLEKTFNLFTGKAKDPSLEIKREYALEAFKRIEGTSLEDWEDKFEKISQLRDITIGIGQGLFLGDVSSINDALFQIKDLLVQNYLDQPKTWFDDVNNLRFLKQEPIEKIINDIFRIRRESNKNYSFFVAEFLLSVAAQPQRKQREKKKAIHALWFLANGLDYFQRNIENLPMKSKRFKYDPDINTYVKESLVALTQNSDMDLSVFIRKLIENPTPSDSLEDSHIELTNPTREQLEQQQEDSAGKKFYLKILREKKPKLYALASIQEHSEKTFEKPDILVGYRVVERDRDYDDAFKKKLEERIAQTQSACLAEGIDHIKSLDEKTTTKKELTRVVEEISTKLIQINPNEQLENADYLSKVKEIKESLQEKVVQIVEKSTANVFDVFEGFLANPFKKVLVIQGDAGAGKTMLMRLFEQKLWKKYNKLFKAEVKNYNRLPLRIVLSEVRSLDKAVEEFLLQHGCDAEGLRDIKKEPIMILFDGFDEINQWVNLYNMNNLQTWKDVKVIFTSRKENLSALKEDYIKCFTPGDDEKKVLSYTIQPVNKEQIKTYFTAQANKNQRKIEKLEQVLNELKGDSLGTRVVSHIIQKEGLYFKKFFQSAEHECLVDNLASLEEHLPEVEQLQEEIAALNNDDIKLVSLSDIFSEQISRLKKITDKSYPESIINTMQQKLPIIEKKEVDLENLMNMMSDEHLISFLKKLKKSKSLDKASKWLEKIIQYTKESDLSDLRRLDDLEEGLKSIEENANPEYFKEFNDKIQEYIDYFKAVNANMLIKCSERGDLDEGFISTINLERCATKIREFSDFEKIKLTVQKLRTGVLEWQALEDEFKSLISTDDNGSKSPEGYSNDQNQEAHLEKMASLISKIENKDETIKEMNKELKMSGDGDAQFYKCSRFWTCFREVYGEPGEEEGKFDEFEYDLKDQLQRINSFGNEDFLRVLQCNKYELILLYRTKQINSMTKRLQENFQEIHVSMEDYKSIKSQNKQGSKVVQALEEQIASLKKARLDESNSLLYKLEEISQDLKALDDEFRTMKDDVTDEALKMSALQKQIKDLKKFADPHNLKHISKKFRDIITSPFMLKMLLQTLIKYPKSSANKAELYRLFANIHFDREKERLLMTEKIPSKFNVIDSFYQYSKDLAINMFIRKITSIQVKSSGYKVLGIMDAKKKNVWSRFFDDSDIMTRLSRRGAQISEDDGVVRFIHKSIMEYFAARQFYEETVDYNADNHEDYDPCLNKGMIVDHETAVYQFVKDIADGLTNEKKKELTVFDKKLVEILNSVALQKQYGDNFDQNYFYPNIFLMVLLREDIKPRNSDLKDDSLISAIINKIFRWIFSTSDASHKYVRVLTQAQNANTQLYANLSSFFPIYYHQASKDEGNGHFKDKFITSKTGSQIKVRLSLDLDEENSFVVKEDAIIQDSDPSNSLWILDAKFFIDGSQDSVVVLRNETVDKYFSVNTSNKNLVEKSVETSSEFVLNSSKTPWDVVECKWILRMKNEAMTDFSLMSLADSSKRLYGRLQTMEDYRILFKDLCHTDIQFGGYSDYSYICVTCKLDLEGKILCKACVENCHKGHEIKDYGPSSGFCDCRFMGCCEIAYGCTARFSLKYKNYEMYKCTQCLSDQKSKVLCIACKNHHQEEHSHQNFEKVLDGGDCECNCIANRTIITSQTQRREYDDSDSDDSDNKKEDSGSEEENDEEENNGNNDNTHNEDR